MKNIRKIILETLLFEGRLETLTNKYADYLDDIKIFDLSKEDPSGNYKYLEWMIKQVIQVADQSDYNQIFEEVTSAVKCFHKNVNRITDKVIKNAFPNDGDKQIKAPKDINSYDLNKLNILCNELEKTATKTGSRYKIYEDERYLIVSPLTNKASCEYGAYSSWCVSTSNTEHFERYTGKGFLVFIIDKQGVYHKKPEANSYKIAIFIPFMKFDNPLEWEYFDMDDNEINPSLALNFVVKNFIQKIIEYSKINLQEKVNKYKDFDRDVKNNAILLLKNKQDVLNDTEKEKGIIIIDPANKKQVDFFSKYFGINDLHSRLIDENPSANYITYNYILFTRLKNGIVQAEPRSLTFSSRSFKKIMEEHPDLNKDSGFIVIPYNFSSKLIIDEVLDDVDFDLVEMTNSDLKIIVDEIIKICNLTYRYLGGFRIESSEYTTRDELKIGDLIYAGRKGYGRIVKKGPKTITIDVNGKLSRITDNRLRKVTEKMVKFADSKGMTNENRWIRKKIV